MVPKKTMKNHDYFYPNAVVGKTSLSSPQGSEETFICSWARIRSLDELLFFILLICRWKLQRNRTNANRKRRSADLPGRSSFVAIVICSVRKCQRRIFEPSFRDMSEGSYCWTFVVQSLDSYFCNCSDYPLKAHTLDCLCKSLSSKGFTTLDQLNLASMYGKAISKSRHWTHEWSPVLGSCFHEQCWNSFVFFHAWMYVWCGILI